MLKVLETVVTLFGLLGLFNKASRLLFDEAIAVIKQTAGRVTGYLCVYYKGLTSVPIRNLDMLGMDECGLLVVHGFPTTLLFMLEHVHLFTILFKVRSLSKWLRCLGGKIPAH